MLLQKGSDHDDRTQNFSLLHLVERRFHIFYADLFGYETAAATGPEGGVNHIGKSRVGKQSRTMSFEEPPRPKTSIKGKSIRISGLGTPTSTTVPAKSLAKKACS